MRIGIIGAMSVEVQDLLAKLEDRRDVKAYGLTFHTGTLAHIPVVLVQSGVGKVNAALAVQQLVDHFQVTGILNTGVAGSIDLSLGVGDFVVSSDAVQHDVDATGFGYKSGQIPGMQLSFPADPSFIKAAEEAFKEIGTTWQSRLLVGRIASGDQFINKSGQKERIRTSFDAACVEMEGAAIAQAATVNAIPFLIIRCMSDTADEKTKRKDYDFNETEMAHRSSRFVLAMLPKLAC